MTDPKAELARALALENETERKLTVIAAVASALADLGVKPVIVGGLAVEYWTYGAYSTTDIDVLLPSSLEVRTQLAELGFERRGRHWVLGEQEVFLEAPGSFLGTGEEAVDIDLGEGRTVSVLRPEDVLIYRLHEFGSEPATARQPPSRSASSSRKSSTWSGSSVARRKNGSPARWMP